MSKGRNQHVVKHNEGWAIRGAGNEKSTKIVDTKEQAVNIARGIAKNQHSELVIHGRNGRIQEKNTYGSDPFPPKG
jgi:hypothetical protein